MNLNKEQVICEIREDEKNACETNINNKESSNILFEVENFDLNKNETISDENKKNTYYIKNISNLETPNSSFDESYDLFYEQNWRNNNAPKKVKRTYVSVLPDWISRNLINKMFLVCSKMKIYVPQLQRKKICRTKYMWVR